MHAPNSMENATVNHGLNKSNVLKLYEKSFKTLFNFNPFNEDSLKIKKYIFYLLSQHLVMFEAHNDILSY